MADGWLNAVLISPDLVWRLSSNERAHAIHGGISADVGDVIAAVAFAHICNFLKVHISSHLNLLHAHMLNFPPYAYV